MIFDIVARTHTSLKEQIKDCHVEVPLIENQPVMLAWQNIFLEVIDPQKGLFVIGWRDD
jgi:hypothetical protein